MANALFVQAAVENLPEELDGIASEVLVQFPWGSLLRGVTAGDETAMGNLRGICLPQARLQVTLGIDLDKDSREWQRLGLPPISVDYIENFLAGRYRQAGFQIVKSERLSVTNLGRRQTSWARRLNGNSSRYFFQIVAVAE